MLPLRRLNAGLLLIAALLTAAALAASPLTATTAKANAPEGKTFAVLAPLLIGDPQNPEGSASRDAWSRFESQLRDVKARRVDAVSTDIWWGLVEARRDNDFDWRYYDKLAAAIRRSGLKWVPILSIHQCGGDGRPTCNIPLPSWLGDKYAAMGRVESADDLAYVSEQGNRNTQFVQPWATSIVLEEYVDFYKAFARHFADYGDIVTEVNLSLGPTGELRYPAYNSHDSGNGYPNRGTLQSYSRLARESFRAFALHRYGSLDGVNRAWNIQLASAAEIRPPSDAEQFFRSNAHFIRYGKDFFDWYTDSLYAHGRMVLKAGARVFHAPASPFKNAAIGAKIPGVSWRTGSDRLAEVTTGLIKTSTGDWDDTGRGAGYRNLIAVFNDVARGSLDSRFVLHFTCLEKSNYADGDYGQARAKDLVRWVGDEAQRQSVTIKGENAVAARLSSRDSWDNIEDALRGSYDGITILRMENVVEDSTARRGLDRLIARFRSGR